MNIGSFTSSIAGEFAFKVVKADTGIVVKEQDFVPNLILDRYLTEVAAEETIDNLFLNVGTGNSTPVSSQKYLDSPYHIHNLSTSISGIKQCISLYNNLFFNRTTKIITLSNTYKASFQFSTDLNLTELGISTTANKDSTNKVPLITRALFKNDQGQPIAVTVKTNEILTIYYRVFKILDTNPTSYVLPYELRSRTKVLGTTNINVTSRILIPANDMELVPSFDNLYYKTSNRYNDFTFHSSHFSYGKYPSYKCFSDTKPTGGDLFYNINGNITTEEQSMETLDRNNTMKGATSYNKPTVSTTPVIRDRFEDDTHYFRYKTTFDTSYGNFPSTTAPEDGNDGTIKSIIIGNKLGYIFANVKREDTQTGISKSNTQNLEVEVEYGVKINRDSVESIKQGIPTLTI